MRPTEPTDDELVTRILEGDQEAASRLFQRYVSGLYGFVHWRAGGDRDLTEEVVQSAFIDAWQSLSEFDRGRDFWFWICGIAKRKLARQRRQAMARQATIAGAAERAPSEASLGADPLEVEEQRTQVGRALSALSSRHRSLLEQKYKEGASLNEIAKRWGEEPAATSSALQRARSAFRQSMLALEKEDER